MFEIQPLFLNIKSPNILAPNGNSKILAAVDYIFIFLCLFEPAVEVTKFFSC